MNIQGSYKQNSENEREIKVAAVGMESGEWNCGDLVKYGIELDVMLKGKERRANCD